MKASRKVLLTIAAGASFAVAVPAFADDCDHDRGYGRWHDREEASVYYGPAPVVYGPPPVYYGPPQVVYAQPRVVYAQPQVVYAQPPVVYAQPPVGYAPPPQIVYSQPR